MPELIALARIGTPEGYIVVEGGTFTTDDENAEILVARGDAELPGKKKSKADAKDSTSADSPS